jgi:hypothetical protein
MISLPLVYTILALVAYTTSFWYLFLKLMAKRDPNHWFIGIILGLGLLLHATVLYHDMLTPMVDKSAITLSKNGVLML